MSLTTWWRSQWVTNRYVKPEVRWVGERREFHLNSCAGHVVFQTPEKDSIRALTGFRDRYINWFERLDRKQSQMKIGWLRIRTPNTFFWLYADLFAKCRTTRYHANLRTRLALGWRVVVWRGWLWWKRYDSLWTFTLVD